MFVIEIEKGHPRAEIGKVLTLLGALGLSTQVITPRTRSLDEAEVDALLTSLLDHGLEQVAAEHRPAVTAALHRMLNSDQPDTRDRITSASVNRVLEGAPPLRPGQLAFILRAAHMDVSRVQGGGDA